LICHRGRGFGYLNTQIVDGFVNVAPRLQITPPDPGREARQARYKQADRLIHVADRFLQRDQLSLLLGNAEPDQFGLRPLKISVRLKRGDCRRSRRRNRKQATRDASTSKPLPSGARCSTPSAS